MKNEFVSYNSALALKELGFDKPCFAFYQNEYAESIPIMVDDNHQYRLTGFRTCKNSEIPEHYVSAPTFSQAFRWFREKHGLIYSIGHMGHSNTWAYEIINITMPGPNYGYAQTYEEAEQACLDELIKIVKDEINKD